MTFEDFKKEAFANDPELKREYDALQKPRLIDVNAFAVTDPVAGYTKNPEWTEDYSDGFDDGVLYILGKLDDAPAVDAVPVVRCKDCIYYRRDTKENVDCCIRRLIYLTEPNNYCSHGVKER